MMIGRFDAAKIEFEQGARLSPNSAEMPYNLGKVHSIQDNWADARRNFELVGFRQSREYIKRATSIYARYVYLYTGKPYELPLKLNPAYLKGKGRATAIPVTDPAEIGRRAEIFNERAGYYYQNWDRLYAGWKDRIAGLISEIESITVPALPEFEDERVVMESTGIAQNHYVRENFHRTFQSLATKPCIVVHVAHPRAAARVPWRMSAR